MTIHVNIDFNISKNEQMELSKNQQDEIDSKIDIIVKSILKKERSQDQYIINSYNYMIDLEKSWKRRFYITLTENLNRNSYQSADAETEDSEESPCSSFTGAYYRYYVDSYTVKGVYYNDLTLKLEESDPTAGEIAQKIANKINAKLTWKNWNPCIIL